MDAKPALERLPLHWLTPGRFVLFMMSLLVAAFPKVLLGFETFYYRDYGVLGYPFVFHAHESFWRGELPLWNPLSNCGAPFLAQWGTMTLYPFSLFYLILPLPWSLTYFCFGHLLLGSLGMYSLCFRWSESRAAAALAGTAYIFNGLTFSCLAWPNYTVALGWMPWVVLTAERAWSQGGRALVIAAVVAALQLLAGVPEITILTWTLIGSFWIYSLTRTKIRATNDRRVSLSPRERAGVRGKEPVEPQSLSSSHPASIRQLLLRFSAVVFLAAGLAAAQLLPFFDLLLHSHRDATFSVSKWAMPSWGWGNFLVPLFHCFESFQGPFFQYGQQFFTSYYLGAGVLALAVWGIWRSRDARVWILAALGVIAMLLALGENGFLFPLVRRFVPLVGIARYPIKFLLLAGFAVPLLAGFAVNRLEVTSNDGRRHTWSFLVVFCSAALLVGATLLIAKSNPFIYDQWPVTLKNGLVRLLFLTLIALGMVVLVRSTVARTRNLVLITLLTVIFGDAMTHTREQNPSLPSDVLNGGLWQAMAASENASAPPPQFGQSRVFITPRAEQHLLRHTIADPLNGLLGQRLALWSNLNLLDGIPKVNGSSTLQIREQMRLQKLLYEQTNALPSGLLDFLGVSYISSPQSLTEWSRRTNFCAFVTGGQKPEFVDDTMVFTKLMDERFDPRQTIFLSRELQSTISITNSTEVQISDASVSVHRVSFHATAAQPALCVVAQSFYHCWHPFIDGEPAKLLRANGAFQAVVVPTGTHHIVFAYRDYSFVVGVIISFVTLVGCIIIWRHHRADAQDSGTLTTERMGLNPIGDCDEVPELVGSPLASSLAPRKREQAPRTPNAGAPEPAVD